MHFQLTRRNIIGAAKNQISMCLCLFEKLPMEQWCNKQWISTQKLPPQHLLPPWYGVVTSIMSERINSMIDDYRSEEWTDL